MDSQFGYGPGYGPVAGAGWPLTTERQIQRLARCDSAIGNPHCLTGAREERIYMTISRLMRSH